MTETELKDVEDRINLKIQKFKDEDYITLNDFNKIICEELGIDFVNTVYGDKIGFDKKFIKRES